LIFAAASGEARMTQDPVVAPAGAVPWGRLQVGRTQGSACCESEVLNDYDSGSLKTLHLS